MLAEDWLALVNGPDGRTVIQRHDDAAGRGWAPLADAGMPVMVPSTFYADVVLVPA